MSIPNLPPSKSVIDTLVGVLEAKEPREKNVGDALGIRLRRVLIASPVESFEGQLAEGPFEKVDFRINKESNVGVLVLNLRAGAPGIMRGELDAARIAPTEPTLIAYPDIPPEGAVSHIYAAGGKEVHLQYGAMTNRLMVAAVHWNGRR